QNETRRAQDEVQKSAGEAKALLDAMKSAKGEVDARIATIRQTVIEVAGRDIDVSPDSKDASGDSLVNLARRIQGVQDNLDALEKRVAALEQRLIERGLIPGIAARTAVSPEQFSQLQGSLNVRQVSTTAVTDSAQTGRQAYDIV